MIRPGIRRLFRLPPRGSQDPVADLEEEIRLHLELRAEQLEREGLPPEQAREAARRRFGPPDEARRTLREAARRRESRLRLREWLAGVRQDLRYALRTLGRSPGFTAVAVLTLALGIGANTAIFSVVNGVLLQPFPYPEADRIVTLWQHDRAAGVERDEVSAANLLDWRERSRSFSGMAAIEPYGLDFQGPEGPVTLDTWLVTEDFFRVMRVPALLGRTLGPADYLQSTRPVYEQGVPSLVLSHGVWRDRFGADPTVVGRTIRVDGSPATVVGVMPPGFQFPDGGSVWAPLAFGQDASRRGALRRGANYLQAVGRLRPGVTLEQARAELAGIAVQLGGEYPETNQHVGVTADPLPETLVGSVRPALLLLLGAVGLVLLIACANVANLLLARGARRQREFAVCAAIGAGRGRLLRQAMAESAVLAVLGAAGGLLLAWWSLRLIVRAAPSDLPRLDGVAIDPWVLLFALGACLLTTLLFGLAPALSLARPDLAASLSGAGRGATAGRRNRRLREGLVVGEIALALLLLVGAALVVRSFVALLQVDRGFRSERVLAVTVQAWSYFPDRAQRAAFVEEAIERMAALPGVEAVGMTSSLPLAESIGAEEAEFEIRGRAAPRTGEAPSAHAALITNGYLDALGIPLRRGRLFTPQDDADAPHVVLVNETMARRHWPGADPVGERLTIRFAGPPVEAEVVGVVGDVRHAGLDVEPEPALYFAYPQARTGAITFTLRTAGPPLALLGAVQGLIWEFNSSMPLADATTLDTLLAESLRSRRFSLFLLGGFAVLALLLATVGVYGLLSYAMRERVSEIGIRMAMGASAGDILRWAMRDGLRLIVAGLAAGVVAVVLLTRLLKSMLYGVGPGDPLALAAAMGLLAATALLATYLPARRASRVDPVDALRAG
ncbi:MAG TPA: ABC transporter permease [Longimicrobiaceae bacterium]|nr:ABC transporter permease [Longimicrobiaceae bacterium]